MSATTRPIKLLSGLLSDNGLTKKAYLNALTVVLDYAAGLLVGFLVTPLMVAGLGDYLFGMWQVLNRMVGYITPASGRPGFALKATLANQQASTDYAQKRRYVGSTLIIWLLFLPLLVGSGAIVSWFVPYWVHAPAQTIWLVRAAAAVLAANLVIDALSSIPQVTLQGENLGYKRMGASVVLVLVGGGFTWLALYLHTGLVGVCAAVFFSTLATGLFYLWVVKSYTPWFGVEKPRAEDTRKMLGLSWWFMGWNLVTSLLLVSDVVVLGILNSVESVTNYTLTKYVPENLIGVIVIVVMGIMPGLGGIIGTGDHGRAIRLRDEINSFIWLTGTALGASILLWNRMFISLWVGPVHYAGRMPNLLIVISAVQLALIRSDGNVIDLTLKMSQKVLLGMLSVAVSVAAASIMVGYFKQGLVGLCLGIMAGRMIISIGYPMLISRFLGAKIGSQLKGMLRPVLVSIVLFAAAAALDGLFSSVIWSGAGGWMLFLAGAGATGIVMTVLSFYAGLTQEQRASMLRRVRVAVSLGGSA
jgi:O-antigen/teichoic acid export membrane protein